MNASEIFSTTKITALKHIWNIVTLQKQRECCCYYTMSKTYNEEALLHALYHCDVCMSLCQVQWKEKGKGKSRRYHHYKNQEM